MKIFYNNNQRLVWIMAGVLTLIVGVVAYYGSPMKTKRAIFDNERVISEKPTPRAVESTASFDARAATSTGQAVSLTSSTHLLIDDGTTIKEGYAIANPVALSWSSDAKLVYIRSLGTVTLGGVSSGWEVAFGSKMLSKQYVISVINGKVAKNAEIIATSFGHDVPMKWHDSGDAIKSIQTSSVFKDATISGLNFYYSEDSKLWGYAISTSRGVVPVFVR